MSDRTIAQRLFDGDCAKCQLEDAIKVEFDHLGWDYYDESLELYGVPASVRLDEESLRVIAWAGFAKVYVNHIDKWETHYTFAPNGTAKPWRVNYPHKRCDGTTGILVEERPKTWPPEWFESGYARVVV